MEDSFARRLDMFRQHIAPPPSFLTAERASTQANQSSNSSVAGSPVVIGSMVLDIHARPFSEELRPGTTTPGKVQYVRGGVGRNIAECLSNLGLAPFFISVIGKDVAGDLLLAHWQSLGLKTDGICCCPKVSTPVVSAIFDGKGELAGAVADVYTLEKYLTPEWIIQFRSHIQCASVIMLDANLNEAALHAACTLAAETKVPIWFEPVSVPKSIRHKSVSNHLMFVSPNEAELVAMATSNPENAIFHSDNYSGIDSLLLALQPHIKKLLGEGVKVIVLTLGGLGAVLCSKSCYMSAAASSDSWLASRRYFASAAEKQSSDNQSSNVCYVHFPALPASVVSLSGAGDCFVAGVLAALCTCRGLLASVAFGIAVAKHAVQSQLNVPSNLSEADLTADAEKVLSSSKQLCLS